MSSGNTFSGMVFYAFSSPLQIRYSHDPRANTFQGPRVGSGLGVFLRKCIALFLLGARGKIGNI